MRKCSPILLSFIVRHCHSLRCNLEAYSGEFLSSVLCWQAFNGALYSACSCQHINITLPQIHQRTNCKSKKKPNKSKQISASKLLIKSAILDISEVIGRNLSGDGAIHQRANNTQDISVIRDCYRVRDVVKMKMFHTTTRQIPFPFGHDWPSSVSADWVLSSPERSGNKKKYKQTQISKYTNKWKTQRKYEMTKEAFAVLSSSPWRRMVYTIQSVSAFCWSRPNSLKEWSLYTLRTLASEGLSRNT